MAFGSASICRSLASALLSEGTAVGYVKDRWVESMEPREEPPMGHMKDLLITIYNGGDEAVAAVEAMSKDWRAQLEQAADEIERLWIPVIERMPEHGVWVLWFNKSWSCQLVVAKRDGESLDWGGDLCGTLHGFTHWMPLPEPPEVK